MTMTLALLLLGGTMAVTVGFLLPVVAGRIRDKHEHGPWVIVGSRYVPPDSTITEITIPAHRIAGVSDLLYGYTTLTERCGDPKCRLIRTRRLSGEVTENAHRVTT